MACHCDNFNPPIKVTEEELKTIRFNHKIHVDEFAITRREAEMLHEYFMHAGYIGFEFDYDVVTHDIIQKLGKFLGKNSPKFGVDR